MAWANYIEDEKKRKQAEADAAFNAGWNNLINKVSSFSSGVGDQIVGNSLKGGADIINYIGSGFNQKEADKRTNDFMESAGFDPKTMTSHLTDTSDKDAYNTGAKTGAIASIVPAIAEGGINDALHLGATIGTGIADVTGNNPIDSMDKNIQSMQDMREQILNNQGSFHAPMAPGKAPESRLTGNDKKLYDSLGDQIDKLTQKKDDEIQRQLDILNPAKAASNAVNTGLNLVGLSAASKLKDANKVGEVINAADNAGNGLKISSRTDKMIQTIKDSSIGQKTGNILNAANDSKFMGKANDIGVAFSNPQTFKSGALAYGTAGGLSAGLDTAANSPGATPLEYAENIYKGAAIGSLGGGLGGGFSEFMRNKLNTNSVADQVAAKDAMISGDKAAQQATDATGKPVTQSQVINSADPAVAKTPLTKPMTGEELAASADRPVGMPMDEYIKQKAAAPENKTMAAEVTPGKTDSLQIETKLDDASAAKLAEEIKAQGLNPKEQMQAIKASGMSDAQAMEHFGTNTTGTVTQKPMQVVDEGKAPIDTSTAGSLGDINGANKDLMAFTDKNVNRTPETKANGLSRALSKATNTWNRSTQLLGEYGSNVAGNALKGSKQHADILESIRPDVEAVQKLGDKLSGKSQAAKAEIGSRINQALEDRPNADNYLKNDKEKELYSHIRDAFDIFKSAMEKNGMPVRENYTPHDFVRDAIESDDFVKNGVLNKRVNTESGNAKERLSQERDEASNENIIDLLPKYSTSMANHIAYSSTRDAIKNGQIAPHILRDTGRTREGMDYLNKMMQDLAPSGKKTWQGKAVDTAANIYYKNALYGNVKNAAFAQIQKVQAMAQTTGAARSLYKSLPKDMQEEAQRGRWFGESTLSQDTMTTAKSSFGKFARKLDVNAHAEENAVKIPYGWGYVQSAMDTPEFKSAKASGKTDVEAMRMVMDNPDTAKIAEWGGNRLVNDTMFGSNSASRPELIRGNSTVKRALSMFQRFGIAQTMYLKDTMTPKAARITDAIMGADPRNVNIATKRDEAQDYINRLNDVKIAAKNGSVPWSEKDVDDQIKIFKDYVNNADKVLGNTSHLSAPKRAAAFTAMWASSAAVTALYDGLAHYGDDKHKPITARDAIDQTDPTALSKINPFNRYSIPRSGLTSPLNPVSPYGGVNNNSLLNLIPGAGIVNRASGNGLSASLREMTNN